MKTRTEFRMNTLHAFSMKTLLIAILISALAGCSPAQASPAPSPQPIDEIRKSLELPELSVEFVENTTMMNAPSLGLEVANYRDSAGRIYSVDPKTNRVVEIDARALLTAISPNAPVVTQEEIKAKAMKFARAVIPDFDTVQSSLQYEEGGKVDNYFFSWYDKAGPGMMNRPFLQFGFHKSGLLFAYYNTLLLEK